MDSPVPPQQPPVGNGPVAFTREAAERVREATLYYERAYANPKVRAGQKPSRAVQPFAYAKTTSAVTAASGSTLGTGTAALCTQSGAVLSVGTTGVTVYNAAGAVASGVYVLLGWAGYGWSLVVAPCS